MNTNWGWGYISAEMQSTYSTAPADWAIIGLKDRFCLVLFILDNAIALVFVMCPDLLQREQYNLCGRIMTLWENSIIWEAQQGYVLYRPSFFFLFFFEEIKKKLHLFQLMYSLWESIYIMDAKCLWLNGYKTGIVKIKDLHK